MGQWGMEFVGASLLAMRYSARWMMIFCTSLVPS